MPTRLFSLMLLVAAGVMCVACSSGRPVHVAFADAEQSYERAEYEAAAADYEYVVKRRPGSIEAKKSRLPLAKSYMAMGRPGMAREHLEAARTQRPGDEEILDLLADAAIEVGDAGEMHESLSTIARERNQPADWRRLGRAMAAAGDVDEAERAFLRAATVDRGRGIDSQIALARFYQDIGDDDGALTRLRMALYIDPSNEAVSSRIRDYGHVPGPTFALRPTEWR